MTQYNYIPDGSYVSKGGKGGATHYPSASGIDHLLHNALELLDVTKYQLGKILGTEYHHYIYRWLKGVNRPSSVYLARLCQVIMMHDTGTPVNLISYIDWRNSQIKWKDGNVTYSDHIFSGWGSVPQEGRKTGRAMAVIPHQPARPDGAHNRGLTDIPGDNASPA